MAFLTNVMVRFGGDEGALEKGSMKAIQRLLSNTLLKNNRRKPTS